MQTPIPSKFGAESTASEVAFGRDLTGKLAVITGAAAGIGKETARILALAGADVVLGGRNQGVLDRACEEVAVSAKGQVHDLLIDLMSLRSVSEFADGVLSLSRPVGILILNAGIMLVPFALSTEGVESQLATNFVGHAFLTSKLTSALLNSAEPRVISLTSSAHQSSPVVFEDINFEHRSYESWSAYAQSKTANALFAVRVGNELGPRGVTAHTVHPGGVATGLLKHAPPNIGGYLAERMQIDLSTVRIKTVEQGAATSVWAATEPALRNHETCYLEDCHVADLIDVPRHTSGVLPFALDGQAASRLWRETEKLIGIPLPLT